MNVLFSCSAADQEHLGHAYASASNLLETGSENQAIGGISIFHLGISLENASCFNLIPINRKSGSLYMLFPGQSLDRNKDTCHHFLQKLKQNICKRDITKEIRKLHKKKCSCFLG